MPRAQREEQILAIAEAVFAERGYQATTMDEVAEQVGVTKPLIYEYFGSKEGLLSAVVGRARTQLGEATISALEQVPASAGVAAAIRATVRAFFEFIDEHAAAFRLLQHEHAMASDASVGLESIREQQGAVLVEALRERVDSGVDEEALEVGAEMVVGVCERFAVWRLRRPHVSSERATDLVTTMLWGGLAAVLTPE